MLPSMERRVSMLVGCWGNGKFCVAPFIIAPIYYLHRYLVLSREMFNPGYALFNPSAADNVTFQPNPQSSINPDHLSYFRFIGRIIGKALFDGQMLDAYLLLLHLYFLDSFLCMFMCIFIWHPKILHSQLLQAHAWRLSELHRHGSYRSRILQEPTLDPRERYHERTRSHVLARNSRIRRGEKHRAQAWWCVHPRYGRKQGGVSS